MAPSHGPKGSAAPAAATSAAAAATSNSRNGSTTKNASAAAAAAASSRPRAPVVPAIPLRLMQRRPNSDAPAAPTTPTSGSAASKKPSASSTPTTASSTTAPPAVKPATATATHIATPKQLSKQNTVPAAATRPKPEPAPVRTPVAAPLDSERRASTQEATPARSSTSSESAAADSHSEANQAPSSGPMPRSMPFHRNPTVVPSSAHSSNVPTAIYGLPPSLPHPPGPPGFILPPPAMSLTPLAGPIPGTASFPGRAAMPLMAPHEFVPPMMPRDPVSDSARLPPHIYPNNNGNNGYHPSHPHHHPQPSDSSVMFGALHESSHTSPAPHAGGLFPPPGMMAYPVEYGMPVSSFEEYAAAPMASAPVEQYQGMPAYSPSTPRSFHGSQASLLVEENGFAQRPVENGGGDEHDQMKHQAPPVLLDHPGHQFATGHFPPIEVRGQEALALDIQHAFADPTYADCELNVFLTDPPAAAEQRSAGDHRRNASTHTLGYRMPVIIPAHRLILARSPLLRDIIRSHGVPDGKVRLFSEDPFIGPDAVWAAVEHLYGRPIQIIPSAPHSEAPELDTKGMFSLAVGYAAAGHLLKLERVVFQGIRDACRLIGWPTLENAIEFALNGASMLYTPPCADQSLTSYPEARYQYGPMVRQLVLDAMRFVVDQFPPNFVLVVNVVDPKYARLPATVASRPASNGPAIVDGRSGKGPRNRLPHNPRAASDPRLSKIKFGDLSPPSNGDSPPHGQSLNSAMQSPPSPAPVREVDAALSRVLLNVPFDFLKYVLESQALGNAAGWMPVQNRQKVVADVIAERESRRLRAVDALRSGRVPNAQAIRRRLENPDPQIIGDVWDVLGWQEQVMAPTQDGCPRISRQWAPLAPVGHGAA